ncbi:DinB family protein [Flavobacterium sp. MAH-1]|uniref:DinB family protein n=1 Tax=Flavobacterium agri TaxID=2743471 RepID=A0A7Y9C628_9FLAO|nr:DinB family protein [Flavobacterium agri]NUY79802.1 DinB family protein [Flavobacterium agri]NYA69827.1 DinB family protein [Flavobacterium agri]
MQGKGAVNALLEIYGNAVDGLKATVRSISAEQLIEIADSKTANPDCRSIQTILTHVVYAGFGYATTIMNRNGHINDRPPRILLHDSQSYCDALDDMMRFTQSVFADITDDELETYDESSKMLTGWKQRYDIEQLAEHAIVHILRHHRQIHNLRKR